MVKSALAELCSENISLSQSTFKLIGVVIQAKHHPCIHISENPTLGTYRPPIELVTFVAFVIVKLTATY